MRSLIFLCTFSMLTSVAFAQSFTESNCQTCSRMHGDLESQSGASIFQQTHSRRNISEDFLNLPYDEILHMNDAGSFKIVFNPARTMRRDYLVNNFSSALNLRAYRLSSSCRRVNQRVGHFRTNYTVLDDSFTELVAGLSAVDGDKNVTSGSLIRSYLTRYAQLDSFDSSEGTGTEQTSCQSFFATLFANFRVSRENQADINRSCERLERTATCMNSVVVRSPNVLDAYNNNPDDESRWLIKVSSRDMEESFTPPPHWIRQR